MARPEEQASKMTYSCPIELTLDLIGGKWKPLILLTLQQHGPLRHGELGRRISGISQKVLTEQLRQLERDGLAVRAAYAEVPPRVEYELTEWGREVESLIDKFCTWVVERAVEVGIRVGPAPLSSHSGAELGRSL